MRLTIRCWFLFVCLGALTPDSHAATNVNLALGTTHGSLIAEPGELDYYVFQGAAGQRLYYDALDTDFDALYVTLLDPAGAPVVLNNRSTDQDMGPFTLSQAGEYTLRCFPLRGGLQ